MKKILYFILLLSSLSFTYAQNQASLPSDTQKTLTKITSVADINVSSVMSEEKDGVIKGSFEMKSGNGKQNEIVFGIVVFDKKRTIVDIKKIGEEKELHGGEIKKYDFTYAVPNTLNGDLSIELVVNTLSGLPLGAQVINKKEYKNTTKSTFSCVSKDEKSVSCISGIDDVLNISYTKGSFFSNSVGQESVNTKKDVPSIITPNLKPGKYSVLVTSKNSGTTRVIPIYVEGSFAEIQNILVTEDVNSVKVTTVVYVTPRNEGFLEVTLFNAKGDVCSKQEKSIEGRSNIVSFENICKEGDVLVRVFDNNKVLLANSIQSFKTENIIPKHNNTNHMDLIKKAFGIFSVLILIAFMFALNRIYKKSTIISIFFILASLQINHVSATTLTAETVGPPGCGACEIAHTLWVTINSDKTSYSAGETMVLTSSVNVYRDAGADSDDSFNASGAYSGGGLFSTGSHTIASLTGHFSQNYTTNVSLSSSLSAGSYTLPVSGSITTSFKTPAGSDSGSDSSNFSYTIAAATPPTVNIQFSFLENIKSYVSLDVKKIASMVSFEKVFAAN